MLNRVYIGTIQGVMYYPDAVALELVLRHLTNVNPSIILMEKTIWTIIRDQTFL